MQIICYNSNNPILEWYEKGLKIRALNVRKRHQQQFDHADFVLDRLCEDFPKLVGRIRDLQGQVSTLTKGVPQTETVDLKEHTEESYQEAVAHAFLLKKAYRAAVAIAHPDKGGSSDDFNLVAAAYKAGDLHSLNEYVISANYNLIERISHCLNDIQRSQIAWTAFQSTEYFRAVKFYMAGDHKRASAQARLLLEVKILSLLKEIN